MKIIFLFFEKNKKGKKKLLSFEAGHGEPPTYVPM